jgi:TPP-dependent pyruvate/acetoin dehydrogenase alpha subunit
MPGVTVDGNDAVALWSVCKEAVERARGGGGPTLIEAKTFRWYGHNYGDAGSYIAKEEMESWQAKDPYPRIRAEVLKSGGASDAEMDAIEAAIEKELDEAVEYATNSPYPGLSELSLDIYDKEIVI